MAAIDPPQRSPVIAAQGDQEGLAFAVAVDDEFVLEEYGLGAESPLADVRAGPDQPPLLPIGQIVRGHDDVVADAEGGIDQFAVGGRRTGGIAVLGVDILQRPMHDGLLPEDLARRAVET